MELIDRIILGSANFGQPYGIIQNKEIKPSEIMDEAWGLGIRWIDTARSYGPSERIIQRQIRNNMEQDWKVISKFRFGNFYDDIEMSRDILGQNLKIELIHNYKQAHAIPDGVYTSKTFDGIYVGASTYGLEDAKDASGKFSFVEIEYNALNPMILDGLRPTDCQVILRSVLQKGFLTETSTREQRQFHPDSDINSQLLLARIELQQIASDNRMSLQDLALKFVAQTTEREMIILGAHEVGQLTRNIEAMTCDPIDEECISRIREAVGYLPPEATDLRNWLI